MSTSRILSVCWQDDVIANLYFINKRQNVKIRTNITTLKSCALGLLFAVYGAGAEAAETVNVLMKTSAGDITIELYSESAPITVRNFLRYVDGALYDNAKFYRVVRMDNQAQNKIKIEVIQGGLNEEADNHPFKSIAHETTEDTGIKHTDGVISMARLEPGSATSEFFICINNQPELDYDGQRNPDGQGFAAFGKVLEGMDIVRRIQNMATDKPQGELEYTSGQILLEPVLIEKITRFDQSTRPRKIEPDAGNQAVEQAREQ